MSKESTLKQRLIEIKQNDYRMDDESQVWPLTEQMMPFVGSIDSELRDTLICDTLFQWAQMYYDAQQLDILLKTALDDEHLFYGLGEQGTDSVYMRSFSSLAVVSFLNRHLMDSCLDTSRVERALHRMSAYLPRERDIRGHDVDKGWSHAVAHAADALDKLALCPELGRAHLLDMLRVIRETITSAAVVFADREDERLVSPVLSIVERDILTSAEMIEWLSVFPEFELPPAGPEWFCRTTNIKHFLRSLYFRSRYAGVSEVFEPALSETLKEVSTRRIPRSYFEP